VEEGSRKREGRRSTKSVRVGKPKDYGYGPRATEILSLMAMVDRS